EDIFAVQDEVVRMIVGTLPGRIEEAGARSAERKRPENLAAYDYLLRGIAQYLTFETGLGEAAGGMVEKAIELDPTLVPAYAYLALREMRNWWHKRSLEARDQAYSLARKAVAFDDNDEHCHRVLGLIHLERRQFDRAEFHISRAAALNPNDPNSAVA